MHLYMFLLKIICYIFCLEIHDLVYNLNKYPIMMTILISSLALTEDDITSSTSHHHKSIISQSLTRYFSNFLHQVLQRIESYIYSLYVTRKPKFYHQPKNQSKHCIKTNIRKLMLTAYTGTMDLPDTKQLGYDSDSAIVGIDN